MKEFRSSTLSDVIEAIPEMVPLLRRGTACFTLLDAVAARAVSESGFGPDGRGAELSEFGHVNLPYRTMGAIDTLDLFGIDELILFSYYLCNKNRYHRVADLGANSGLHTLLMGRLGWQVEAYEPDPQHAEVIKRNLQLNGIDLVTIHEEAVSAEAGTVEFVRVLGNTTGSHIAGAKDQPYGDLETFSVRAEGIQTIMANADFIKMDVEGQEARIVCGTSAEDWKGTDVMLEVGTQENANRIYAHLADLGVGMFPQKVGWTQAESASDLPTHHSQGSLFVSSAGGPRWA